MLVIYCILITRGGWMLKFLGIYEYDLIFVSVSLFE